MVEVRGDQRTDRERHQQQRRPTHCVARVGKPIHNKGEEHNGQGHELQCRAVGGVRRVEEFTQHPTTEHFREQQERDNYQRPMLRSEAMSDDEHRDEDQGKYHQRRDRNADHP